MAASDPQAMVDAEQLFHDLEQRYVRLREEHGRISSERDTLRDANATLEATVSAARRQLAETQSGLSASAQEEPMRLEGRAAPRPGGRAVQPLLELRSDAGEHEGQSGSLGGLSRDGERHLKECTAIVRRSS